MLPPHRLASRLRSHGAALAVLSVIMLNGCSGPEKSAPDGAPLASAAAAAPAGANVIGLAGVAPTVVDTAPVEPTSADSVGSPNASTATEPGQLRVVTWNIRHALGMDGRLDLDRVAARLAALAPDVVFLQEVDRLTLRSGNVDQAETLGHALGMWASFGAFMPLEGGEYGLAILTRWPPADVRNVPLPPGDREPRTSLAATIAPEPGISVRLYNVHLDWLEDDSDRYAQAEALLNVVSADVAALGRAPAIIAGDFNDGPGSRTIALVRSKLTEAVKSAPAPAPALAAGSAAVAAPPTATFPSDDPKQEIDFIFVLPGGVLTALPASSVGAEGASDHRPVVAGVVVRK